MDGITFDSMREAARYVHLRALLKTGAIRELECHRRWQIDVNGRKVCSYESDFTYVDVATGALVVEDVKGMRTPVYRLKKKLMLAVHGVEVVEV